MNDLRFAFRQLLKNPGFATVVVFTLALGIGANTAVFSVVYGVLLRPLPYPESERLVLVFEENQEKGQRQGRTSPPTFLDWQQNRVFSHISPILSDRFLFTGESEPAWVNGLGVTADFFPMLGLRMALGSRIPSESSSWFRRNPAWSSGKLWVWWVT